MHIKSKLLWLPGILLLLLSGCFWKSANKNTEKKMYLVNVLDADFFEDCHIPGSLNISMMDIKNVAQEWPKDATIVFYCSNYSCQASPQCCKMLTKMGFTNTLDYEAGIAGWYQAHLQDPEGYPIIGACKQPYLTMENRPFDDQAPEGVKIITTEELRSLLESNQEEA